MMDFHLSMGCHLSDAMLPHDPILALVHVARLDAVS